jgi:hypothetical protein
MSVMIWKNTDDFNWYNLPAFVWRDEAVDGLMLVIFSQLCARIDFDTLPSE